MYFIGRFFFLLIHSFDLISTKMVLHRALGIRSVGVCKRIMPLGGAVGWPDSKHWSRWSCWLTWTCVCESVGPSECPTCSAPSSSTLLCACECVSSVFSRCDWIVHRCLNASRGGVTVLTVARERESEHANASRLKDVWDLCDHAVR